MTITPGAILSKKVLTFIQSQTVITLCVCDNNVPYTAMCYYVYLPEENIIVFKSKQETTHMNVALKNSLIAGAVRQDKLLSTNVVGVQLTGMLLASNNNSLLSIATRKYYMKYPFAVAVSGDIWMIRPDTIKYTENKMGIMGKEEYRLITE
ncbi:hypothetical protein QEG73_19905 [Chitinophagaceae bacterium 26-R-25]|nr:hypothetical protein [Chitinophagaceae bacterium 26-R-25]